MGRLGDIGYAANLGSVPRPISVGDATVRVGQGSRYGSADLGLQPLQGYSTVSSAFPTITVRAMSVLLAGRAPLISVALHRYLVVVVVSGELLRRQVKSTIVVSIQIGSSSRSVRRVLVVGRRHEGEHAG